jgi:hypothetical protein
MEWVGSGPAWQGCNEAIVCFLCSLAIIAVRKRLGFGAKSKADMLLTYLGMHNIARIDKKQ